SFMERVQRPDSSSKPLPAVPLGQVFENSSGIQCTAYAVTRFDEAAGIQKSKHDFKAEYAKDLYTAAGKTWVTAGPDYRNPPPGSLAVYDDSINAKGQTWSGEGHVAVV